MPVVWHNMGHGSTSHGRNHCPLAPEAQAIIRPLLAWIAESETPIAELKADRPALKARIEQLGRQAKGKAPQNSSLRMERAAFPRAGRRPVQWEENWGLVRSNEC